jgi:hypothetical protein
MVTLDLSKMGVKPPPSGQPPLTPGQQDIANKIPAQPNDNNPTQYPAQDTAGGGTKEDTIKGAEGTDLYDDKAPAGYKAASVSVTKEVTVECYYLYSVRPGLGAFITDTKRAKFDGNYLKTDDKQVKDYLLEHHADHVKEISAEQYEEAHTLKQDQ